MRARPDLRDQPSGRPRKLEGLLWSRLEPLHVRFLLSALRAAFESPAPGSWLPAAQSRTRGAALFGAVCGRRMGVRLGLVR
jgi:hypothetical protein